MTRRAWTLAGCAALAGMLQAAPAQATIYDFFVNGTVTAGIDQTNTFGLGSNADLSGRTYLAHFVYDSSIVPPTTGPNSFETLVDITKNPVSATITINGVGLPITGNFGGVALQENAGRFGLAFGAGAGDETVNNNIDFLGTYLLLGGNFNPADFGGPFDPTAPATPFFLNPQAGDTFLGELDLPAADGTNENVIGLDVEHVSNFFIGGSAGDSGRAGISNSGGGIPVGETKVSVPPTPDGFRALVDVPEPPAISLMAMSLVALMLRRRGRPSPA